MKKLLSIVALLGLTASCFATGPIPANSVQSGVINFTNGGPWAYTNTFPVPYSYPPIFTAFLTSANTNALPFTNTVTATNFILTENSTVGSGTNATIVWSATPANYIIQAAAVVVNSPLTTNISFPQPFSYTPVVTISGSVTSSNTISSITTSNITVVCNVSNTINYIAFGPDAARIQSGPNGTDGVVTH
jgi:hypothetical protein